MDIGLLDKSDLDTKGGGNGFTLTFFGHEADMFDDLGGGWFHCFGCFRVVVVVVVVVVGGGGFFVGIVG